MNWFKLECTTRAFVTALWLTVRYEMSVIIIIIIIIIATNPPFLKNSSRILKLGLIEKNIKTWPTEDAQNNRLYT